MNQLNADKPDQDSWWLVVFLLSLCPATCTRPSHPSHSVPSQKAKKNSHRLNSTCNKLIIPTVSLDSLSSSYKLSVYWPCLYTPPAPLNPIPNMYSGYKQEVQYNTYDACLCVATTLCGLLHDHERASPRIGVCVYTKRTKVASIR